ncbi:S-adenosyl-L-methionine-dependent methyltransferase [Chaetomium sp. MPI-SDFR-AT-0129]|nr:S-adenosyl-L-methionine-dependent methyltransferase [Chaetomium sp. MPI-SDFR-AT-0129]
MPRLPPSLFWRASKEISPLAARLLPVCRDLQSAANELRWIREHVRSTQSPVPDGLRFWSLVEKRATGVPLQYVLGNQPFGDLEILCRRGVLIPRPETEAYTLHIASLLTKSSPTSLNILDLCTGTGCIPLLLLHSLLSSSSVSGPISLQGVDISPHAVRLARDNFAHNIRLGLLPASTVGRDSPSLPENQNPRYYTMKFTEQDIFSPSFLSSHLPSSQPSPQPSPQPTSKDIKNPDLDLLISNPPYISPSSFTSRTTARAVRQHEPRLALVPEPISSILSAHSHTHSQAHSLGSREGGLSQKIYESCHHADVFYARLAEIVGILRPKRVVMEVGGWGQAMRVVRGFVVDGWGSHNSLSTHNRSSGDGSGYESSESKSGSGSGSGSEGLLGPGRGQGEYEIEVWRDEPTGENDARHWAVVDQREIAVRGRGLARVVYLVRRDCWEDEGRKS